MLLFHSQLSCCVHNCTLVHFSDCADDFRESADDASESAGDDGKDHKPGIPSGACNIISKVCSPMGCVWVSKIFRMGATWDELQKDGMGKLGLAAWKPPEFQFRNRVGGAATDEKPP